MPSESKAEAEMASENIERVGSLRTLHLAGWKSIQTIDPPLAFGPINVFIGANGAGKSNLISFFRLLNRMISKRLQEYLGASGGAESVFYLGSKHTARIEATLEFCSKDGTNRYFLRLVQAAGDTLIFSEERLEFQRGGKGTPKTLVLGAGHRETLLHAEADKEKQEVANGIKKKRIANVTRSLLAKCRVFHFHDTSETARVRSAGYIEDNRFLHVAAENLAAILYLYRERHSAEYRRIAAAVSMAVPGFEDFILEPQRLNPNNILLKWKRGGSEYELGPHQFSDGSIRFIALATLLNQPVESLPTMIIIDEPELGLHPAAIELVAGMAKAASQHSQIVLATQSPVLLDHFSADEVIVVNNRQGASEFQRLSSQDLEAWLHDYTISEIWEKNVVGGGPYA
jgi:predicted ATPase